MSLRAHGITVPLLDQRAEKTLEWIKKQIEKGFFPESALVCKDFSPASQETLRLAHDENFLNNCEKNPDEEVIRAFELVDELGNYNRFEPDQGSRPLCELMTKIKMQVSASVFAADMAVKRGFAFFLGGGLHHAMSFQGEGFCLFNDIVIAAKHLQSCHGLGQIWVVDVDAHKGDGTAQLVKEDSSVSTFSIHMAKGWPLDAPSVDKEGRLNPSFIPSSVDVPIENGEEREYIKKLMDGLNKMSVTCPPPEAVIIVQGSDPCCNDELPSTYGLSLSLDQMLQRDRVVYEFFGKMKIPQLYLMGGGYGKRAHEPYIQFLESVKYEIKSNSQ